MPYRAKKMNKNVEKKQRKKIKQNTHGLGIELATL